MINFNENNIQIKFLADHPEMIPACASWAYGQWGTQSGGSLERALTRFSEGANSIKIPLTLVAVDNGKPVGMISLWATGFDKRPDLSPWLSSLFVHPFYRGKHTASFLIKQLESEAKRMGHSACILLPKKPKDCMKNITGKNLTKLSAFMVMLR